MFKSDRFLRDQFHSPDRLRRFLLAYGAEAPEYAAAQKWFERGSLPGRWLGVLLAYLEIERGGPVSLAQYMVAR